MVKTVRKWRGEERQGQSRRAERQRENIYETWIERAIERKREDKGEG